MVSVKIDRVKIEIMFRDRSGKMNLIEQSMLMDRTEAEIDRYCHDFVTLN